MEIMEKNAVLTIGLENLDMEASAIVAQKAILQEIYLVDAKISRKPLIISPEVLTLEHHCSTELLSRQDDDDLFIESILCNFRVAAFSEKSPKKPLMKIEATFCASFDSSGLQLIPDFDLDSEDDEEDNEDEIRRVQVFRLYFYRVNPIAIAWPYWREFVQSMSTRMGYPALTIPTLAIVPKKSVEQETKGQPVKRKSRRAKKVSA